jgi:anti-sigma28 factor (negative regulator of flagellin synthesis)
MKIDERKVTLDALIGDIATARARASGSLGAEDRVEVSAAARVLAELRPALGEVDVVRHDRVIELRATMESGSFRAHPPDIARSLLREVLGQLVV